MSQSHLVHNFPLYEEDRQLAYILKVEFQQGRGQLLLYSLMLNAVYEGLIGLPGFLHSAQTPRPAGGDYTIWVDDDGVQLAIIDEFDLSFCFDLCGKQPDDILREIQDILLDRDRILDLVSADIPDDEWIALPADFRIEKLTLNNPTS